VRDLTYHHFLCQRLKAEGYDPKRSRVSDSTLADFLRAPLTGDLQEVPGIGKAAEEKLRTGNDYDEEPITNTYQLIGKFLMLKGPDEDGIKVESIEHVEKFWHWLKNRGISSYRSGIVRSIAEKVDHMMPGVYEKDVYGDDSDEE